MDFENMIANLNKNYDILEKKIDRLVKQRNELKIINSNFTINIKNSQKVYFFKKPFKYYKNNYERSFANMNQC